MESVKWTNLEGKRIVYLTAGAAGMYCGSCMRDNALAAELIRQGVDVTLLPLYTPIRTDEEDVSVEKVFFGGVNVYLQQKVPIFRHLPSFLDRWLDNPALIKRLTSKSVNVEAKELGGLTLSMVKGESGFQRKEVRKLVAYLRDEIKPDLICLTNLLIGGSIPAIRRELPGVPILVTLQGDDVFLDELVEPFRTQVTDEMKALAQEVDGFVTFSDFYAKVMSEKLEIPAEKFHITVLGLDSSEFVDLRSEPSDVPKIGYFARICPEKGFDILVDAFVQLREKGIEAELWAGGWLAEKDQDFYEIQLGKLRDSNCYEAFHYVGSPEREGKLDFFRQIDVFSVPARFVEPKGIYALEAMAAGVPVVQPDHGAFPEMIQSSQGGRLFTRLEANALAEELETYLESIELRIEHGESGRRWVSEKAGRPAMVESTVEVFSRFV